MAGALGLVLTGDTVSVEGRHAIPVYVDDTLPIVGPARACVIADGTNIPFAGGPPLAVRLAPAGTNAIGPALPVYVVPGGGSLGASFTPAQIVGLQAWYKADAIVGLNNNDPVASWVDSIGVAGAATQATGGNQPTYKTAIQNGLPVVRGNGTSTFLDTAAIAHSITTGDFFFAAVVKTPTTFAGNAPAVSDLGTDTPMFFFSTAGKPDLYLSSDHVYNGALSISTWYTIIHRRIAGTIECWVNGVKDPTTFGVATTIGNASVLRLGAEGGVAARWWGGDTGEFLFGKTLADADRAALESYLRTKWAHY